MKKTLKITVSDSAVYYIEADDNDMGLAEDLALKWFSERKPVVNVSVCDEKPDITIGRF